MSEQLARLLEAWRKAERELATLTTGAPTWQDAARLVDEARAAYRARLAELLAERPTPAGRPTDASPDALLGAMAPAQGPKPAARRCRACPCLRLLREAGPMRCYMLAGSASTNPILFALTVGLMLAWRVAGYCGLDRYLLPRLGVPWTRRAASADRAGAAST